MAQVRDELGLRREALLREARPGRVDGSTVYFYIASHLGFHLQQLQEDTRVAGVIAEQARSLLGADITVSFVAEPDGAPRVAADVAADEPLPRKEDLVVAETANDDVVALVEDILGGEVIEESAPAD
jgi:hypothetical protein